MKKTIHPTLRAAAAAVFAASAVFALRAEHAGPSVSPADGCERLEENPACGPAGGNWTVLRRGSPTPPANPSRFFSKLWDLSQFSGGNNLEKKSPRPGRLGGEDVPFDEFALGTIRQSLSNARANGAQGILRFGYAWDDTIGSEPSDPAMIRKHIAQIAEVLREFPDVVYAVEGGMFGPWGEMNYSGYCRPDRCVPIIEAWLRELPPSMPLLVRSPCYLIWHAGTDSKTFDAAVREGRLDWPGADRLGMYNDGYLGSMGDFGTWHDSPPPSSGLTREMGVRWLETRKGGIPYGGEFAYCNLQWVTNPGPVGNPKLNLVQEWYRTHLTYLRDFSEGQSIGHLLSTIALTPDLARFPGAPSLEEWIGRDLKEFVRTHLGYRYVMRGVRFPASVPAGLPFRLGLDVENTGFNQSHWPTRAEIVFVPRDGASEVRVPVALDLSTLEGAASGTFSAEAAVPDSLRGREADVYLDLRLALPRPEGVVAEDPRIRFANEGVWDATRRACRLGWTVFE